MENYCMKNIALNTLKYTGIVTLSQYIGSKKIEIAKKHNIGGSPLFSFLARCLIGDFTTAKLARPAKIRLLEYKINNTGDTEYTAKSGFINLLTMPEILDPMQCRVRYSFIVPKDHFSSINFAQSQFGIGLYTANATNESDFAAFCKLDGLSENNLINASLVVDWELIISNTKVE